MHSKKCFIVLQARILFFIVVLYFFCVLGHIHWIKALLLTLLLGITSNGAQRNMWGFDLALEVNILKLTLRETQWSLRYLHEGVGFSLCLPSCPGLFSTFLALDSLYLCFYQ